MLGSWFNGPGSMVLARIPLLPFSAKVIKDVTSSSRVSNVCILCFFSLSNSSFCINLSSLIHDFRIVLTWADSTAFYCFLSVCSQEADSLLFFEEMAVSSLSIHLRVISESYFLHIFSWLVETLACNLSWKDSSGKSFFIIKLAGSLIRRPKLLMYWSAS